ncbi:MAG: DUF5343 domain-containing protein [Anaerolineales bacterium]|jgi:hypothetical protein
MNEKRKYPDTRIKAINEIFELIKDEKSWRPEPISTSTLKILKIASSKESNAIFALKFLGLIDDDGIPTSDFDNLRNNFQETLSILVQKNYSELLEIIPIRRINQDSLLSFFTAAGFSIDTAEYQAKLFIELCRLAEITLPNVEGKISRTRMRRGVNDN